MPHTPIAQGWLRCSHRKLDPKLTLPYRPYHTHDEEQKLKPGEVYEVDVEVWPTCIVVPKGYRSRCRCAAPTMCIRASRAPASRRSARCGPASGPSPMTIRATARRRCSAATSRCTPVRDRQAYVLLPVIPEEIEAEQQRIHGVES